MFRIYANRASKTVNLGHKGENEARCVVFDISSFLEEFGEDGAYEIVFQRSSSETPYLTLNSYQLDTYVVWVLTNTDTDVVGEGRCEVRYKVDDMIVKTDIYTTYLQESLGDTGEAPSPSEDLIEKISALKTATETAASNAKTSETNAAESESKSAEYETSISAMNDTVKANATNAKTSETNAATSADNANKSATAAATSAENASTSEDNASKSASAANASATDASTSAKNAKTSETNAATSASSIQTSMEKIDSFDDRLTQLEKASALCIGIKRKCQADGTPQSDTKWTRWGQYTDAVVEFARGTEEVQNDLMGVYPYNACRPCNLALGDDGEPVAYLGDADFDWYAETGVAAGTSVMLEVPTEWYAAHWFETDANGQNWEYKCIADSPRYPHSVYIKEEMKRSDGTYTDYFYFPIFLGYVDADGHYISKAGVQPTYDLSVTTARTKVKTNGANWQIIDVWAWEIIALLCDVMSANEDCKAAFGNGISNWYLRVNITTAQTSANSVIVAASNAKSFNVGDIVSIGTADWNQSIAKQRTITAIDTTTGAITLSGDAFTTAVGNVIWREVKASGETVSMASANGSAGASDYKHSVRTLWIENLYGAMHTGVDGINLKFNETSMGLEQYACKDPSKYSDAYGDGYELLDNLLPLNSANSNYSNDGYIKKMFFDSDYPLLEMPDSIGGGSNTYEAAYAWRNKNGQRPFFGGAFYNGASVSLRSRRCYFSFGFASRVYASRPLRR